MAYYPISTRQADTFITAIVYYVTKTTIKLQAEAHVTIQEIKFLGVLQTETSH